ncbi:phosphonate transport system ATP-binding protein [Permianibacter aggregans]|uniref:Phosphonate transport system ATP-binding protein n=1 Tax=Permianibacter aggregans TaxID=1510150 RepID=A0A4R6UB42_9GAMM|nr:phosphonate transport system ATP-binding protein [Permianibacter aggregans]
MSSVIEAPSIRLQLNGVTILDGIQLRVEAGEQLAIIGPSGAGKTSLLRVLASEWRSQPPALLFGKDPWALSGRERQRLRRDIGLIWQKPPLPPTQRVITAVSAGRLADWSLLKSLRTLWHHDDAERIQTVLQSLGIADKLLQRCGELSGGQLQRAGIARVLYQSPKLILADEPVSALDPTLACHTIDVICSHARQHQLALVASLHAVDLALALFPRIIGLRDGKIQFDCPPAHISTAMLDALYAGEHAAVAFANPATVPAARCS